MRGDTGDGGGCPAAVRMNASGSRGGSGQAVSLIADTGITAACNKVCARSMKARIAAGARALVDINAGGKTADDRGCPFRARTSAAIASGGCDLIAANGSCITTIKTVIGRRALVFVDASRLPTDCG